MGCGSSTPALQEPSSNPGSGAARQKGSAANGSVAGTPSGRVQKARSGRGGSSGRGAQPGASKDKHQTFTFPGFEELGEVIVKDPERLGLSLDFAQQALEPRPPREFSFEELEAATEGFSESCVIGEGGYGKVYRGRILCDDGSGELQTVAIKKLNQEGLQGFNEWLTEVIFLRRLRHPHLVGFVGYCTEEEQGVLVYDYMANGSLDLHLFKEYGKPPLTWQRRVDVAFGAAKGLAYLHEGTGRSVIFRDLKAANILLDEDFNARLSDFGLAKDGPAGDRTHVSTKVVGTYGYTAPEYMQTGHLTAKSDVYAFGVVLLELLSGLRAVDEARSWEERNLAFWAKPYLADKRKLPSLLDARLEGKYPMRAAQKLAVAASCCLLDVKSRPSMVQIVQILAGIKELGEKLSLPATPPSLDSAGLPKTEQGEAEQGAAPRLGEGQ